VPTFSLFSEDGGERTCVLSPSQEKIYLEFAPQPWRELALLMLDTGLRLGEACSAAWESVHLEPAPGAKGGYIHVPKGKTRNAAQSKT
jgi:integrase